MKKKILVGLLLVATAFGLAFAGDIKPLELSNGENVILSQSAEIEYTVTVTGFKSNHGKKGESKTASFKIAAKSASEAKKEAINTFKNLYSDYASDNWITATACASSNDSCYAF